MANLVASSADFAKRLQQRRQPRAQEPKATGGNEPSHAHGTEGQADHRPTNIVNDAQDEVVPLVFRGTPPMGPLPEGGMTRMSQAFALEAGIQQASHLAARGDQTSSTSNHNGFESSSSGSSSNNGSPIGDTFPPYSHSSFWKPLAVRAMPPLPEQKLANKPMALESMETFTKSFLVGTLGGKEWSPGFYWNPGNKQLASGTYYLLDTATEPYLPQTPGEHGAKLSVFFRDFDDDTNEEHYDNFPLFICTNSGTTSTTTNSGKKGEKAYTYFGTYSQARWSDKLDYDRVLENVPYAVKQYWARLLASRDRPQWVTEKLVNHFVPRPEFQAATLPSPSHLADEPHQQDSAVKDYLETVEEWQTEKENFLNDLTETYIVESFTKADADNPPGLRFWWEYLQCTSFDRSFYQILSTQSRGSQGRGQGRAE